MPGADLLGTAHLLVRERDGTELVGASGPSAWVGGRTPVCLGARHTQALPRFSLRPGIRSNRSRWKSLEHREIRRGESRWADRTRPAGFACFPYSYNRQARSKLHPGIGARPIPNPMEGNVGMTIVSAVVIHPRSPEVWDELQKLLKKGKAIIEKHGGENVTLLVTLIGGQQTNDLTMLITAESWTKFGQVQEAVYGDSEMLALLAESGKIATWEIYTAQTLEL